MIVSELALAMLLSAHGFATRTLCSCFAFMPMNFKVVFNTRDNLQHNVAQKIEHCWEFLNPNQIQHVAKSNVVRKIVLSTILHCVQYMLCEKAMLQVVLCNTAFGAKERLLFSILVTK